jgi:hypothetical protein
MAQIAQLQVSYSQTEDRLLLRMSTDNREEFRFWVTRRYLLLLRPVLRTMTERSGKAASAADAGAKRTVTQFEKEQALATVDFATAFDEADQTLPMGDVPVLLARIQSKTGPSGNIVLCLHSDTGVGVELAMEIGLLHSLASLLDQGISQANWAITEPEASAEGPPAGRFLN